MLIHYNLYTSPIKRLSFFEVCFTLYKREMSQMEKLEQVAKHLRSIGVIVGVPTVVGLAIYFHNAEVSALRAENDLLRHTQYDKALPMIEAQNKLRQHEHRIVAESLALTNELMVDVEKFTHIQGSLSDNFSTDSFERDIQEVATKLKELHALMTVNPKKE